MKRVLIGLLFALGLAMPGWTQGIPYNNVAFTLNNMGEVIPAGGAQIDVCQPTDTGLPCTNHVNVFSDAAMAHQITQPFFADLYGNFNFYAATCGPFVYTVTGATVLPKSYPINPCGNGGAINPSSVNGIIFVDGVTYPTLALAVAACKNPGEVIVPPGTYPVTANLTIPTTCTLEMNSGAVLSIANAVTLTIGGPFIAPQAQVFSLVGSGLVSFGISKPSVTNFYPQWWGAKCDNAFTDDTAAFQATINAVIANTGGSIVVPAAQHCLIAGQLIFDQARNVTLTSPEGPFLGPIAATGAQLTFSGTTSPLISAKSVRGLKIENVQILYTNAAFAGMVIDLEHASSGAYTGDSEAVIIQSNLIMGQSTSAGALCLICGDNTDNIWIQFNSFDWSVNAIRGAASAATNSNVWNITNNVFSQPQPGGDISGTFLVNPGRSWNIVDNDFELGTGGGQVNGIDCSAASVTECVGLNFESNWVGDQPAGWTGTFIKGCGGTASGIHIAGNYINGATGATFLSTLSSGCSGVKISGNSIQGYGTLIAFAGTANFFFDLSDNSLAGITNVFTGTRPNSSCLQDLNTNLICYGSVTGVSTNFFPHGITDGSTNPAQTGLARCGNNAGCVYGRNAANNADIEEIGVDAGNVIDIGTFNNGAPVRVSGGLTLPPLAVGTAATLTGTGACATITTQTGGSFAGRATCTGTTGASTFIITTGITAPNGFTCSAFDQTTRANLLQQTATSATACTLTATSITQNDVIVFSATAF